MRLSRFASASLMFWRARAAACRSPKRAEILEEMVRFRVEKKWSSP
jgi:hypothetical protein